MGSVSIVLLLALAGAGPAEAPRNWWVSLGSGIGEVEVVGHDRSELVAEALVDAGLTPTAVLSGEDDATRTLALAMGYRLNPYLGIGLAWQDLGTTEGGFVAQIEGETRPLSGSVESAYRAWSLAATAYWPVLNWLMLQGRLGAHFWQHEFELRAGDRPLKQAVQDSGTGALLGLGIGFTPLPWFGIDVYWERFHGIEGEAGIDVKSIAAVFRF